MTPEQALKGMLLNEYQQRAMQTRMPSCHNLMYALLNLGSEVGELQGALAKAIRKEEAEINFNDLDFSTAVNSNLDVSKALIDKLRDELGDVLWQCACVADNMGWTLNDIAILNLKKLQARKADGTIATHTDH